MAAPSHNAQQLHNAFELFNQHSGSLEESYRDLQDTVEALTLRLRREQSARLQELVRKEKLSHYLTELLEELPGAILVLDCDGVVRRRNSEAGALLNRPLLGHSWSSIVSREIAECASEDGNIQLRDGRWLSLSRRPLKTDSSEILLLADVTESRQIAKLRQRDERLTAIGEMTADFAHQVRTPLASAMLYTGQLDISDPVQSRIAGKIRTGLNDLKRMVNDMLGFAAGARSAQECVNVVGLLSDVRDSVECQLGNGSTLQVSVMDPTLVVAANKDAIQGALLNLVTNADQAGDGKANILLHGHRFGDAIHLCVTDDGPGISEAIRPRLFEPFFTTRPQGTGLGLSVVKAVVAAHDGDVLLNTSELGTSFTIRLPCGNDGGAEA